MDKVNIFVPEPLRDKPIALPFWSRFPGVGRSVFYDKQLPPNFFDTNVNYVEAENAQAIVLPNSFVKFDNHTDDCIKKYADLGQVLGIPVFVFSFGDLNDRVRFDPRVYVFRQSVYRSTMRPQDIVVPTLTGDYGNTGMSLRQKNVLPIVSFCGQAGYKTIQQEIKYHIKVWLWKVTSISKPSLRARTVGVYWRKKMLNACTDSTLVKTLFIIRHSFSGAHRTIELDPKIAHKEFVDSIINSDFVLAPKGDGNYSNRFLEALSLGRIPVLLDTDTVLPLEREIAYEKVIVRVPMEKVADTPKFIREWYDNLSEEDWKLAQVAARELYVSVLRLDSFFKYFFDTVFTTLPKKPPVSD